MKRYPRSCSTKGRKTDVLSDPRHPAAAFRRAGERVERFFKAIVAVARKSVEFNPVEARLQLLRFVRLLRRGREKARRRGAELFRRRDGQA